MACGALITRTDVKVVLARTHTTRNIKTLLVDADKNLAILVIRSLPVNTAQIVNEQVEASNGHLASHEQKIRFT